MLMMYLMRGCSGSGKSYKAKQLVGSSGRIISADNFWGPEYRFNRDFLSMSHQWCLAETVKAMLEGVTPIVIDNTNTQRWEAKRYVEMAIRFGYAIEIVESDSPWRHDAEECYRRNVHKVPLEVIKAQLARWEDDFSISAICASSVPQRS